MPAVGAGPLDQVVLEHQRGDPGRPGAGDPAGQIGQVHVILEGAQRHLDLARVGVRTRLDPPRAYHCGEAVLLDRQQWQGGTGALDQVEYPRIRPQPEGQHHAGERDGTGGMRGGRGHDQVGPVARRDEQAPVHQMVQDGRYLRRADDEAEHVPGQRLGGTQQPVGVQFGDHFGDRGGGQAGYLGDGVQRDGQAGQRRQQGLAQVRGDPVGHHGEHLGPGAGQRVIPAAYRVHQLGQLAPVPVHHADDQAAHLGGQPGTQRHLAGAHVRLRFTGIQVGTHHQRHRVLVGHRAVPRHHQADQLLQPAFGEQPAGLRVGHAVGRRTRDPVPAAQHRQQRIVGARDHRAEHAESGYPAGEQFGDAERGQRLAGTGGEPRDVHAARHAAPPPPVCDPGGPTSDHGDRLRRYSTRGA